MALIFSIQVHLQFTCSRLTKQCQYPGVPREFYEISIALFVGTACIAMYFKICLVIYSEYVIISFQWGK